MAKKNQKDEDQKVISASDIKKSIPKRTVKIGTPDVDENGSPILQDIDLTDESDRSVTVEMLKGYTGAVSESLVKITDKSVFRKLVDGYYQTQKNRIATGNQIKAIEVEHDDESYHCEPLRWIYLARYEEESSIKKMIEESVNNFPVGRWLNEIIGIGPLISGSLLSYFDVTKAGVNSAGSFWSYCGLNDVHEIFLGKDKATDIVSDFINRKDPTITTEKLVAISMLTGRSVDKLSRMVDKDTGNLTKSSLIKKLSMPPYNTTLRTLCWKIGESFLKRSSNPNSLYGRLYIERRQYETEKNLKGEYKVEAMVALGYLTRIQANMIKTNNTQEYVDKLFIKMLTEVKNNTFTPVIGKKTAVYSQYINGMLPNGHIFARSKRYPVKIFVSHLFEAMWIDQYQTLPPIPYTLSYGGHKDYIGPEVPYDMLWRTESKIPDMEEKVKQCLDQGIYNPGGINSFMATYDKNSEGIYVPEQPIITNTDTISTKIPKTPSEVTWAWLNSVINEITTESIESKVSPKTVVDARIKSNQYTPDVGKLVMRFIA